VFLNDLRVVFSPLRGVVLLDKPFSEAELINKAGQVLNGHFRGYATVTS
jgi:hypothetical protein